MVLFEGLCHLTSEEKARKVFIQENGHELLWKYFNVKYRVMMQNKDFNKELKVCFGRLLFTV
jgi:hypothetical protein